MALLIIGTTDWMIAIYAAWNEIDPSGESPGSGKPPFPSAVWWGSTIIGKRSQNLLGSMVNVCDTNSTTPNYGGYSLSGCVVWSTGIDGTWFFQAPTDPSSAS